METEALSILQRWDGPLALLFLLVAVGVLWRQHVHRDRRLEEEIEARRKEVDRLTDELDRIRWGSGYHAPPD